MKDCVGCGYCCTKAPCGLAMVYYMNEWASPCPALVFKDNRYWCRFVLEAKGKPNEEFLKEDLAIGAGCSSTLFNTVREEQIARMNGTVTGDRDEATERRAADDSDAVPRIADQGNAQQGHVVSGDVQSSRACE